MVLVQKYPFFESFFFCQYRPGKCLLRYFTTKKTPFQAIKCILRYSATRNRLFFVRLFLGNIGQENVFYDILEQKTPFQAIKTTSSKSRKIDIFPKGLTHGFGPKMAIFPNSFFQAIQARKMCFTIFQNEKKPFQALKTRSSKSRKIDNFQGLNHGFRPKLAIFPNSFFQAIQARKMCFTIFQNEKKPFQALKTKSSKSRKIDNFPKGLNHGFRPKMAIFPNFFFQAIQARKMSFTISQNKKKAFLGYRNKKFKKSKN